jgi:hypothetical protein
MHQYQTQLQNRDDYSHRLKRAAYHLLWALDHFSTRDISNLRFAKARKRLHGEEAATRIAKPNVFVPVEERRETTLSASVLQNLPLDRPLVFRGLLNETCARKNWTFDYISKACAGIEQPFFTVVEEKVKMELLPFEEGVEKIVCGNPPLAYIGGTYDVLRRRPDLNRDLEFDRVFDPAFFKTKVNVHHKIFLAANGGWVSLHTENGSAFNLLLNGKKRWLLIRPEDSWLLRPRITRNLAIMSEICRQTPALVPLGIQGWEANVESGDLLYFPPYFWHYAENLADSISVEFKWTDLHRMLDHPFLVSLILSSRKPNMLQYLRQMHDSTLYPPADTLHY